MKRKKFKYRKTDGQRGIVLRGYDGGPSIFRIYEKDGEFKDYEILYDDLGVIIDDKDSEFLESEDGTEMYLDYARTVIGQESKYDRIENKKTDE